MKKCLFLLSALLAAGTAIAREVADVTLTESDLV